MTDIFEKTYMDWSIDVGIYKYEGITLNEVEQNLYAIEDQEQDFVVISPSKAISIDNKLYNFVQVCSDQDTDLLHIELSVINNMVIEAPSYMVKMNWDIKRYYR